MPARTPASVRASVGSIAYVVVCTAPGLGTSALGFAFGPLSTTVPVTIVTSPRPLGAPLEPFDVNADGELGPSGRYTVAIRSEALALAGGVEIVVRSERPLVGVRSLRAAVLERIQVGAVRRERLVPLFDVPLGRLDKATARGLAHATRWPGCSDLAPSTHSGTRGAAIVVEHELVIELTTARSPVPIARVRGLKLSSCAVRDEFALVPPSYAAANRPTPKLARDEPCPCGRVPSRPSSPRAVSVPRAFLDVKRPRVARFDSGESVV